MSTNNNEQEPKAVSEQAPAAPKRYNPFATSRLIVKNIPKHVTEERLKEHFKSKGFVTDAKIMKKGDKSRLFCFIGYKTEAEASVAKKFFHNTFLDTSRIAVDFAKPQGDPELPRAWSKFSKGSSAYQALNGKDQKASRYNPSQAEKDAKLADLEKKKDRFRQFLSVMGLTKDSRQSWNDNFAAFMADEGSGLLHTSKPEDEKKRRKQKEAEKEKKKEEVKEVKDTEEAVVDIDKEMIDEQRLYVMNLPFTITHDELKELFSRFGEIEETEIPLRRGGTGYGFAFVRYATIEGSVSAFAELDKTYFQGRKIHILPA